ncbi:L-serine ammonia-lyase [Hahella sp. SMD15-11]|uniref:L-serine dehydratase n=1 Tax=Thermohahella caldifontis TaxID=3142973 RepID=A0AB39UT67_9GAMM
MPGRTGTPCSVFDVFRIGVGPSSSHTMGPMVAARRFAAQVRSLADMARVRITLYGSLAATGKGHATDKAVFWGLSGLLPEAITQEAQAGVLEDIRQGRLRLDGDRVLPFDPQTDLLWRPDDLLPGHPNGIRFEALNAEGMTCHALNAWSVGGGVVRYEDENPETSGVTEVPFPFDTAVELMRLCKKHNMRVSEVVRANELARRSEAELSQGISQIWRVMQDCVARGLRNEGTLPGGLRVRRRAPGLYRALQSGATANLIATTMQGMDWLNLYALAVNEENAAGGQVVTAPTNGAAGIIPAVLHYFTHYTDTLDSDAIERFFLAATAVGSLIRRNASISGAEVGCQGEVGSACAMAAAGLTEALGGSPRQVENAAEIGLEHNLGLTCDPVKGLVQVPCIERNAIAAVKAVNAAQLALRGDGFHFVSLDRVIRTLKETGADMADKYKETARGGLAVNYPEC